MMSFESRNVCALASASGWCLPQPEQPWRGHHRRRRPADCASERVGVSGQLLDLGGGALVGPEDRRVERAPSRVDRHERVHEAAEADGDYALGPTSGAASTRRIPPTMVCHHASASDSIHVGCG